MTAPTARILFRRVAVPLWLVAVLVAAAVAVGALALLSGESTQPAGAADNTPPISQTTTCVDSATVGHC
jgi:hypothetical protein